jgi:hypothetical protein
MLQSDPFELDECETQLGNEGLQNEFEALLATSSREGYTTF